MKKNAREEKSQLNISKVIGRERRNMEFTVLYCEFDTANNCYVIDESFELKEK
jgi:hypothetical protein